MVPAGDAILGVQQEIQIRGCPSTRLSKRIERERKLIKNVKDRYIGVKNGERKNENRLERDPGGTNAVEMMQLSSCRLRRCRIRLIAPMAQAIFLEMFSI